MLILVVCLKCMICVGENKVLIFMQTGSEYIHIYNYITIREIDSCICDVCICFWLCAWLQEMDVL